MEQLRIRPSNWKLFELDLDRQVLFTKSTAAIPGTVKLDETIYYIIYIHIYHIIHTNIQIYHILKLVLI